MTLPPNGSKHAYLILFVTSCCLTTYPYLNYLTLGISVVGRICGYIMHYMTDMSA